MKKKLSISIEEKTIKKLDEYMEDGAFRNKSHVIEFAVNKFMEEERKMTLYTKSITKPVEAQDGYRICIMRNPIDYANKGLYDEWVPTLSPPQALRDKAKQGQKWDEFKPEFLNYLATDAGAIQALDNIAKRALTQDITLLCVEDSPDRCHRSLVANAISEKYSQLGVVIK